MQQTNVLEYLEHTVKRLPDKVAYSNESEGLTFAEVYHDSRAIGSYLNSKGYYGEPVVVFMKKHPKAIAAFYGCVYGGKLAGYCIEIGNVIYVDAKEKYCG